MRPRVSLLTCVLQTNMTTLTTTATAERGPKRFTGGDPHRYRKQKIRKQGRKPVKKKKKKKKIHLKKHGSRMAQEWPKSGLNRGAGHTIIFNILRLFFSDSDCSLCFNFNPHPNAGSRTRSSRWTSTPQTQRRFWSEGRILLLRHSAPFAN